MSKKIALCFLTISILTFFCSCSKLDVNNLTVETNVKNNSSTNAPETTMQIILQPEATETNNGSKYYWAINTGTVEIPNYHYYIFGLNGKIIIEDNIGREPTIQKLNNNFLKLVFGVGDYYQVQFVDLAKNIASEFFDTPKIFDIEKGLIVYMQYDGDKITLNIRDIFDKNKLFKEYIRDFSPVAVPKYALSYAEFLNDKQLKITYLEGKNRDVKEEVINFNE